jgi:hypothetical protein
MEEGGRSSAFMIGSLILDAACFDKGCVASTREPELHGFPVNNVGQEISPP